jgi:hypothetical protein
MIYLVEGYCSQVQKQWFLSWFPWSRDAAVRYWTKSFYHDFLCREMLSLDQVNHDRNPWFSTLLQHPSISEIMIDSLGSIPYCSIPPSGKWWWKTLVQYPVRYCTKGFYHDLLDRWMLQQGLNHGFLSWFTWSRDTAVRYWTKVFYHDFLDRGMLQ